MENNKEKVNDEVVFNIENSKALFNEIHSYFKENKKLSEIKIKEKEEKKEESNLIKKFKVEKNNQNIFENISDIKELINIKFEIQDITKNLLEDIQGILVENKNNDNIKAMKAIFNSLKNFYKNLDKLDRDFENDLSLDKNIEKVMDNLSKLVEKRIIKDCIAPIYQGMVHTDDNIYYKLLICINDWFKEIGIYTIDINENGNVEDDNIMNYMEIVGKESIEDYNLKGQIKELVQYPYAFDERNIICDGKLICWGVE